MGYRLIRAVLGSLICALLVSPSISSACGGICGGGGHPAESRFKGTVLSHLRHLQGLPDAARSLLKFEVGEVMLALEQQGQFKSLCATDDKLEKIIKAGKAAMVFEDDPNVVYVDCKTRDDKSWERLLDSQRPTDIAFFIHEGLRVLKRELNEDDYHYSGSVVDAIEKEDEIIQPIIANLFKRKIDGCEARVISSDAGIALKIRQDGQNIYIRFLWDFEEDKPKRTNLNEVQSRIELGSGFQSESKDNTPITRHYLYKVMMIHGCLDSRN